MEMIAAFLLGLVWMKCFRFGQALYWNLVTFIAFRRWSLTPADQDHCPRLDRFGQGLKQLHAGGHPEYWKSWSVGLGWKFTRHR